MSKSYRLYCAAIGGLILALTVMGLVWLFIASLWPDNPLSREPHPIPSLADYLADNLDPDCQALNAAPRISDPNPKQTNECADKTTAQKYNHATLAQGIRTANAAVYSAYIVYLQTCIGIIGALLVVASLAFSAAAAWAGVYAARAAGKAALAAEAAINAEEDREGPFLYPILGSNSFRRSFDAAALYTSPNSPPLKPFRGEAQFALHNYGRSAAVVQSIQTQVIHLSQMMPGLPLSAPLDYDVPLIIEPDKTGGSVHHAGLLIPIDAEAVASIISRNSFLFLIGRISFGSVSGTGYEQTFCMAYDPKSRDFKPWGTAHNKRSRTDKPDR